MSSTFDRIRELIRAGEVRTSEHASIEMDKDDIFFGELLESVETCELLEDYPDHKRGPCILLMHDAPAGRRVHAVWGIPIGYSTPAVLVTAYIPDPERWDNDLRKRRQ